MHEVQREGNNLFLTTYFWTFDPRMLFYYVTVTSGNVSHSLLKFQITAVLKISEKLQVLMINDKFGFLVILQPHVSNYVNMESVKDVFPKAVKKHLF